MRAKISFFLVLLFLSLTCLAEARITLGMLEGRAPFGSNDRGLGDLSDYLQQELGEEVRVRLFRENGTLHEWLSRFREVDFALVDSAFVRAQPQGEFLHVADFQPLGRHSLAPDVLVARQGLPRQQVQSVHDALTRMADDPEGRRVLGVLGVERFLTAGSSFPRSHDYRSSQKTISKKQALSAPGNKNAANSTGSSKPEPAPAEPKVQIPKTVLEPDTDEVRPAIKVANNQLVAEKTTPSALTAGQEKPLSGQGGGRPKKVEPSAPSLKAEAGDVPPHGTGNVSPAEAVADSAPTSPPAENPAKGRETRIWIEESAPAAKKLRAPEQFLHQESSPAPVGSPSGAPEKPAGEAGSDEIPLGRKLVDALVVLCAGSATFYFFRRRRAAARTAEEKARKPVDQRDDEDYIHITDASLSGESPMAKAFPGPVRKQDSSPFFREKKDESAREVPPGRDSVEKPHAPANSRRNDEKVEDAIELKGALDLFQVSSLLQMIASYPRPGTLVIESPHDSKRIHFRFGKVAQAVSINQHTGSQAGFLMNKLGYLLIRMGMITEKERDQALEICDKNPRRRIGEVLIEMNALSRDNLKRALRTQAEGVIFSLFLFPEGRFELTHEDLNIPAEDDLGLRVESLLDEAARHEEEWSGLRATIPSLDTILAYSDEGREKLESARMTAHQQLVLSLIDGRRNLKDICREATMLDFEVYKFVYLMVRANILQPASTG